MATPARRIRKAIKMFFDAHREMNPEEYEKKEDETTVDLVVSLMIVDFTKEILQNYIKGRFGMEEVMRMATVLPYNFAANLNQEQADELKKFICENIDEAVKEFKGQGIEDGITLGT